MSTNSCKRGFFDRYSLNFAVSSFGKSGFEYRFLKNLQKLDHIKNIKSRAMCGKQLKFSEPAPVDVTPLVHIAAERFHEFFFLLSHELSILIIITVPQFLFKWAFTVSSGKCVINCLTLLRSRLAIMQLTSNHGDFGLILLFLRLFRHFVH